MHLSISTKLSLGFLLAATLPASAAMALLIERNVEDATQRIEGHFTSLALARNELLDRHARALSTVAASLAETDLTRRFLVALERGRGENDLSTAALEDLFRVTRDQTWGDIGDIFLFDAYGRVALGPPRITERDHASSTHLRLGDRIDDRDFFAASLEAPMVTRLVDPAPGGHDRELILRPVHGADGRALGVVAVEVALDAVDELLTKNDALGAGVRQTLVTNDGERVVDLGNDAELSIATAGLERAVEKNRATFGEFEREDGTTVLGCYLPSSVFPWTLCIEVDRDAAMAAIAAGRESSIRGLAISASILALFGALIGLRFASPLRRCADAARHVSRGELDHPIAITRPPDEFGTLERSVESMRVKLRDQITTLDARVEQRTEQLERALQNVREVKERFRLSVEGSRDGIWDWDVFSGYIHYSPRWREMLGLGETFGRSIEDWVELVHPDDREDFEEHVARHLDGVTEHLDVELRMLHADGEQRWMLCRGRAQRDDDGRAIRLSGSLTDTTEVRRITEELHEMAHHDRLTGLANRVLFTHCLQEEIDRVAETGGLGFAVLFFDFDRFKLINDSLGHEAGDAVLLQIAERFMDTLGPNDLAARFGGDEFVVLLRYTSATEDVELVCNKLLDVMAVPYDLDGNEVTSTASIGYVAHAEGRVRPEDVIRDADAAMYQAKAAGKARFRAFDESMHQYALRQLRLEQCLRQADFDAELRLLYQPIVRVETGELKGFEALVRWESPTLGLVGPDEFISVAEETGLIVPIGEWVMRSAARQLTAWQEHFGSERHLTVNVNVSRRQLIHSSFMGMLEDVRATHDFAERTLVAEITETTMADSGEDIVGVMRRMRDLGYPLAMDDFGTGYSSLSCLHAFPLDVLKVDRSFVQNLEKSSQFIGVVQSIVTLAHHLGLHIVAEGVETPGQLALLEKMGCQSVQGFHFARPLSAEEATELLIDGQRGTAAA